MSESLLCGYVRTVIVRYGREQFRPIAVRLAITANARGFTCPRADSDLRVGGTTTVTMQAPPEFGGFQLHNQWRFTVVEKPVRIEFVSTFVDADGNTITPAAAGIPGTGVPDEVPHLVTFVAVGEGQTEIRITERGYTSAAAREQSKAGQAQVLDKMQAMFAAPSR